MARARTLIAMDRALEEGVWSDVKSAGRAIGGAAKAVALGTFDPRRVPDDPKRPDPDRPLRPSFVTGFYRGLKNSGALDGKSGIRIKSPNPASTKPSPTVQAAVPSASFDYAKRTNAAKLHKRVLGEHPPDSASTTEIHARVLRHLNTRPNPQQR
jgi:hypothetical protein